MTTNQTFWQFTQNDTSYKRWLKWLGLTFFITSMLYIISLNIPFKSLPAWVFILVQHFIAAIGFYLDSWRLYQRQKKA